MEQQALIVGRLDRIEGNVIDLQRQVATLDTLLASLRGGLTAQPAENRCATCNGGNPLEARRCMWCGVALEIATSAPLTVPSAQTTTLHTADEPAQNRDTTALPGPAPEDDTAQRETPAPGHSPFAGLDFLGTSEFWLNKVGIALLLLGLAFFFKYSVDRGWLIESVRVALGLLLGTGLLVVGLHLHERRWHFSQVLLGGSLAAYYITGFAAYTLLHVWSYEVAFGFMALTTALAFALALRQDHPLLSIIGVFGGLVTPFVLPTVADGVGGLIVCTCIIQAGAVAVYFFRGWRSLLLTAFGGGWLVFVLAWLSIFYSSKRSMADIWALEGAALFSLFAFWIVPVLAELYYDTGANEAPRATERWKSLLDKETAHVHVLVLVSGFLAWFHAVASWSPALTWAQSGGLALAGAAIFAAAAWLLRHKLPAFAYTHVLTAILFGTLGLALVVDTRVLLPVLALEALALHYAARRFTDGLIGFAAGLLWVTVAVGLLGHLSHDIGLFPALSLASVADLIAIALLAAASFWATSRNITWLYRLFIHLALCLWLYDRLYHLQYGDALLMLTWAAYALTLNYAYQRSPRLFDYLETVGAGHIIFGGSLCLFVLRLVAGHNGALALLNIDTLFDVTLLTVLGWLALNAQEEETRLAYKLTAHVGLLALLARELLALPSGNAYVSIAWGAYGATLLVLGLRGSRNVQLLYGGIATMLVVVAKLFLVDLALLDPGWRVLLFIGFGGAFLLLSYVFGGVVRGRGILGRLGGKPS